MCGISGVLAFKTSNFQVTEDYLLRMRETMVHRGPDGAGFGFLQTGGSASHIGGFPSSIFPTPLHSP